MFPLWRSGENVSLESAAKTEGIGLFAYGGDAEGDVIVERNAKFFGTFEHVFAADPAGEGFILHALFYRADFEIENAFRRPNVGAGGQKAGKFVAGEQRVFEWRLTRDAGVVGVREDGTNKLFAVTMRAEDFSAFSGMFTVGGMVVVGPALVVEVVEEGGEGPEV